MRTWGSVLVSVNCTFAVFAQAFMWVIMRARRSAGGLSRKPTVRRTPAVCQRFAIMTAMRSSCEPGPPKPRATIADGGWFAGLISTALRAASTHFSRGNDFGVHTMGSLI